MSTERARQPTGPLDGVYTLGGGDAHLPSSKLDAAFSHVGVDRSATPIAQAIQMMETTADTLASIAEMLEGSSPASEAQVSP